MAKLKITQVRSTIKRQENQKRTMKALGLRKLHHSVIHEDVPQIRGMISHGVPSGESGRRQVDAKVLPQCLQDSMKIILT